ncbi:hypothetical protein ILUMI_16472, partial [Ignelater luminosus]
MFVLFQKSPKSYILSHRSKIEGYSRTRLPLFTSEEIRYIRGTSDFIAVNHYTTFYTVNDKTIRPPTKSPSSLTDSRTIVWQDDNWPIGVLSEFRTVPWGFRKVLKWLRDNYDDPDIYITENGFAENIQNLHDKKRIDYIISYLSSLLDAIYEDGVK